MKEEEHNHMRIYEHRIPEIQRLRRGPFAVEAAKLVSGVCLLLAGLTQFAASRAGPWAVEIVPGIAALGGIALVGSAFADYFGNRQKPDANLTRHDIMIRYMAQQIRH